MKTHSNWKNNTDNMSSIYYSKEETIESVQSNFDFRRYYSAEGKSVTVDGITEQVIIQDHRNPLNEDKTDRKIHLPNTSLAHIGSTVVFDNTTWLIVSNIKDVGGAYKSAQILQTNYTLKFQDKTTAEILSYPAIFSTKGLSNTGEIDYNKVIATLDGRATLTLTYDAYTTQFVEGDRVIVDGRANNPKPTTYKIGHVNDVEKFGGLIILSLERDEFRSDADRADLGICNHFTIPQGSTGTATITGDTQLKCGGSYRTYQVTFKDEDDNVLNLVPIWALTSNVSGGVSNFTTVIDNATKTIKIKCNDVSTMIGTTLTLSVSGEDEVNEITYTATLAISVVALMS